MTFIASVIAKRGVAIIADSLVTTKVPSIELSEFLDFIKSESDKSDSGEIKLDPNEIIKLFKSRPSYTKDFEEKLFKFDEYTAITTAGSASINDKRIISLIDNEIKRNKQDKNYNKKGIETKVKNLCKSIEKEIKEHLKSKTSIRPTKFIVTHYDKNKELTVIYKVNVNSASKEDLEDDKFEFITYKKANDWEKVVCDGQNRTSEKILYGSLDEVYSLVPRLASKIINDFNIKSDKIPSDYIKNLTNDKDVISPNLFDDMKIFKLSELSLQQAVDLASLFMRLEIDFQTYTENIPTVGGVIKIGVIDKDGFRFLNGHEILKPNNV